MSVDDRQPHAALDLAERSLKARKIERLLALDDLPAMRRLLEVGAGSGGISHYFGTHEILRFQVKAVDVHDSRVVRDGFEFSLVEGTALPFDDECFDVVLSNHVFEHVGDDAAQANHLRELFRVLVPGGVGYLAVPNRWMLVEPHFRVPLLSWWPESWRSAWLKLWGKGAFYDCRPPSRASLEGLLRATGFASEQLHASALRATFEIERPDARVWRSFLRHVPDSAYWLFAGVFPTLIYRLRRPNA